MRKFWIIFWPESKPYISLVNIRKNYDFFFQFFPQFQLRGIWIFFCNRFTVVLLDGILHDFSKFQLFIVKNCIFIWPFWILFENYAMLWLSIQGNDIMALGACTETISSHTECTPNKFLRILSQRSNFDSLIHGHPNECWANAETISSLTEHTRKQFHRLRSIQGNGFRDGEIFSVKRGLNFMMINPSSLRRGT
jgi:hypothetical protein